MRLRQRKHILVIAGILACFIQTSLAQNHDSFDWSESTFVIWPLKNNAPDQQSVASLSDWFRVHAMSGRPGVRFILNNIALSGIRTVWWRSVGGGWVHYPTNTEDATVARYADTAFDEKAMNHLEEATAFAHKLGMKIYAWFPVLEEAHAWPENSRSRYVDLHPNQWDKTIEGYPAGMPSFYYQEYRDYKLAIARELVTKYAFDGLVLDFERQGAPYRSDKCGYLPQIVEAFKAKTGKDPRTLRQDDPEWQRFRASYVGRFVKDVRNMVDGLNRPVTLVMMYQPQEPLTAHWDAVEWAKRGYFDSFALAAHGPAKEGWESPTDKAEEIQKETRKLDHPTSLIYYSAGPKIENLQTRIRRGIQAGFSSIVYFESTHLFWNHRFSVPLSLAMPYGAVMRGPAVDWSQGGRIRISSAGKWTLRIDSVEAKAIAHGAAEELSSVPLPEMKGKHRLVFTCELPANASMAGLAVEGWAAGSDGVRQPIRTDASWEAQGNGLTLTTIGQPGIPPFMFTSSSDQGRDK